MTDTAPSTAPVTVPAARPGPAWLTRCDPSVLLAVVLAVPVVLVRTYEPVTLTVLWVLAVVAALTAARVGVRRLLLAQLPFASFGLSLVMVNAVTRAGTVLAQVGPLEVTDEGLLMGVALAVRSLLVGVCAAAFLTVVDPARLLVSLHVVARLPARVTCAFLAAHRLLDDLPEEWTAIRRAHAVRRPADARGRREPGRDVRSLGRAAFVLLATTIRRAERIAVALESRGLGAVPRAQRTVWAGAVERTGVEAPDGARGASTARRPGSLGGADVVLVAVVGVCLALALAAAGAPGQALWTAITTAA